MSFSLHLGNNWYRVLTIILKDYPIKAKVEQLVKSAFINIWILVLLTVFGCKTRSIWSGDPDRKEDSRGEEAKICSGTFSFPHLGRFRHQEINLALNPSSWVGCYCLGLYALVWIHFRDRKLKPSYTLRFKLSWVTHRILMKNNLEIKKKELCQSYMFTVQDNQWIRL